MPVRATKFEHTVTWCQPAIFDFAVLPPRVGRYLPAPPFQSQARKHRGVRWFSARSRTVYRLVVSAMCTTGRPARTPIRPPPPRRRRASTTGRMSSSAPSDVSCSAQEAAQSAPPDRLSASTIERSIIKAIQIPSTSESSTARLLWTGTASVVIRTGIRRKLQSPKSNTDQTTSARSSSSAGARKCCRRASTGAVCSRVQQPSSGTGHRIQVIDS
jgi:hypothetical protein